MTEHYKYLQRCIALASLGAGNVAPNPMVGAIIVHKDRIIGEGWHQHYGNAHAEVNCINTVSENDRTLIGASTLYVSLEPCAHFGKTPPCADLIIHQKIPNVIIGCSDPFAAVDGKGIEKMKAAGINVLLIGGELEKKCVDLNKRFFTFHKMQRPYIILKWAETADGKMAAPLKTPTGETEDPGIKRLLISNEYSNRLVHKWRSEEAAIMVGTNTALLDNPELTTRLWNGKSPVRLVIDMDLRLPASFKIFNKQTPTVIFNTKKNEEDGNLRYYKIEKKDSILAMMNALHELQIQSILVEGGAKLLQSFIAAGVWDEARVIQNSKLKIQKGLNAPVLPGALKIDEQKILSDKVEIFINRNNLS